MAFITGTGKVTTNAGTAVQALAAAAFKGKNSFVIQALPTNTGNLTLGSSAVVHATGANGFRILTPGAYFSTGSEGLNDLDPTKIYFDVAVNGEGVIAGALER